ncbi:MAG: hypothetical protein QG656_850, partial [Candidatus Hydrogenedentes bacterium]|nr:hypothetical protein [Candidatus Hydrogenedentota bacterium]
RELCYYAALSPHRFQFVFLKQGLHNNPNELRQRVQEAIDAVDPAECDAILLGYGLCSNGLAGVVARSTRLVVMRGHDCITFLLGSKERYRTYFDAHPGTYWYSPGWIETTTQPGQERYEAALRHYIEIYGEENAAYLMEATENWIHEYNNAAYVDLGFGDSEAHKAFTRECAEWLDWQCDFLEGDPGLVRRYVSGDWNPEDFLVVEPGERIVASYDERVIATERGSDDGG